MQTEKLVFKSLFGKTELANQKIELGISEDMAKLTSESEAMLTKLRNDNNSLRNADKAISDAIAQGQKMKSEALKNINSAESIMKKIPSILSKAEASAKDLGLDVKSIPTYSPLSKILDILEVYTEDKEFSEYKNL
jgi:hypothetical protein